MSELSQLGKDIGVIPQSGTYLSASKDKKKNKRIQEIIREIYAGRQFQQSTEQKQQLTEEEYKAIEVEADLMKTGVEETVEEE
jgi:hypothetical protein